MLQSSLITFHLITRGGVSQLNPELANMANLARRLVPGESRLHLLSSRISAGLSHPPSIYTDSENLNSCLHICIANILLAFVFLQ